MSNSRPVERAADAAGVVFIAIVTALMADRLVAWFQQLVDFWYHQGGVVSAVVPAVGAVLALVIVRLAQVTPATDGVLRRFPRRGRPAHTGAS